MISVLYIDDEPDLLDVAKSFLEQKEDIHVDIDTSGIHALEVLKTSTYDVILSDYMMPEMDGISLLKKIREMYPTLPFIIFTGRGREEIVIAALNNGANFYLQKGGEPASQYAELEHKIRLATDHRRANDRIIILNRLYAVLSQVNLAIVRTRPQDALLREVCRIAVEQGKFHLAWVGMIDKTHMIMNSVAFEGPDKKFSRQIAFFPKTGVQPDYPGIQTLLDKNHFICNNIRNSPLSLERKEEAQRYGSNAFGAFPLTFHNNVIGALFVYAPDSLLFGQEEIQLLEEVASDISFALETLDEEAHRKLAENALRDSEQRYRSFINSMTDMAFLKDGQGRYVVVNSALEKFFGTGQGSIIGKTDFDLMPTALAEQCQDSDKTTLTTGNVSVFTEINENRTYESHKFPVRLHDGTVFVGGYIRDITEQRRSEQALRDSELRYRIVANNTYDWELWWDPDQNYLYVSPSVKRVTGHSPEEFIRDPDLLWRIVHPDDRHRFQEHQQGVVRTKDPGQVEFRIILPDGTLRWIDHACEPVYNDEGRYLGHRACNRDITDRKDLERKLFRLNQIQTSIIQNAHIWLMILDEKGNAKTWNTAAEKISGFTPEEAVGNPDLWKHLYPEKGYRSFVTTRIREIIERNEYFENLETMIRIKSGELKYMLWNTQKLLEPAENQVSYISVGRDITSYKIAQETIESFATYMNNNPDPVLQINKEGVLIEANEASAPVIATWNCKVGGKVPDPVIMVIRAVFDTLSPKTFTTGSGETEYTFDLFPNREGTVVNVYGRRGQGIGLL
ncbi:MAG: PAS domain S-box protein [Methanoregula sp.]